MPIRIIDGFYLGSSTPLDSRFVVDNSTDRNSLMHKYDGLKVFQLSDRKTYIWNEGSSTWDLEGSSMNGSGVTNSIAKWSSTNNISDSNIFIDSQYVGINTTTPKSNLQINSNTYGPISIGLRNSGLNDISTIGYNWYYEGIDQRFSTTKLSSKIEMGSNFGLSFQIRGTSSTNWIPTFEVGNTNGYNFLRSLDKGNFISGSSSFGNGTIPYISSQFLSIDGSIRLNGASYDKVSTLIFSGLSITKQPGFTYSLSNPATTVTNGSSYIIDSSDRYLIVYNGSSSPMTLRLPVLPNNCDQIGRIIDINYKNGNNQLLYINVNGSTPLKSSDGTTLLSLSLITGESIRIISSYDDSGIPIWKVFQFSNSISNTMGITASNGDFLYYSTSWVGTNFESKMRNVLSGLSSTQNEFLIKLNGGVNKSYIMFPQSAPTTLYNSSRSEIRLSGGFQLGDAKLTLTHIPSTIDSGYSVILAEGYQNGSGQALYLQSSNNATSSTIEKIKIQTRNFDPSIVGGSDPVAQNGSIQIASKTSVDFISQTGEYYLGNRLHTSASAAVLPPIDNTLSSALVLNTTTGKINRTTFDFYTDISNTVSFGSGLSGTKNVRQYKDGTIVVSFYYVGSNINLSVYSDVLTGLPSSFGKNFIRARYGVNNLQPNTMSHADFTISGTSILSGISSISFGYLEFTAIYKKN